MEEEFMAYQFCSSPKMERLRVVLSILDASIGLRQCCRASKLVCRRTINMALSIFRADNAGERRVEVVDGFGPGDLVR
jgi:hypothetical protein